LSTKDAAKLPLFGVYRCRQRQYRRRRLPTTPPSDRLFAYTPSRDATAVARLRANGAIVIGKTNLDQFATGLVGGALALRIPKIRCEGDLIPGGSSSGSAVAVSAGLVPIALGTDTAGSGRGRRCSTTLSAKAERRPDFQRRRRAGVPDAGLSIDSIAHDGRRDDRNWPDARYPTAPIRSRAVGRFRP